MEKVVKIRRGKFIEVDVQVIRWQRQMRRFRKYRALIIQEVLAWYGGDMDKAGLFLRSPHFDLGNQAPKTFFNPKQVRKLYKWVKKLGRSW